MRSRRNRFWTVRAWLARHPRWTFDFTPTSCLLAQRRRKLLLEDDAAARPPRRLSLIADLQATINACLAEHNAR